MDSTHPRRLRPWLAFLLGLLGLGYLYVGALPLAVAAFLGTWGFFALACWTRLIVLNSTVFWVIPAIILIAQIVILVHPVVIAIRTRQDVRHWYNRWWIYLAWMLSCALMGGTLISHRETIFGYTTFHMPSSSMEPTLMKGDFFMTDTWWYHTHQPSIGDIVAFERSDKPRVRFVKRVVGLPGDRLYAQEGILHRNGKAVSESFLHPPDDHNSFGRDFPEITIDSGHVFVMGDYRDNSEDSRYFGTVDISRVSGRATYIWLSIGSDRIRSERIGIDLRPDSLVGQ
jgi:signal peptidase I